MALVQMILITIDFQVRYEARVEDSTRDQKGCVFQNANANRKLVMISNLMPPLMDAVCISFERKLTIRHRFVNRQPARYS